MVDVATSVVADYPEIGSFQAHFVADIFKGVLTDTVEDLHWALAGPLACVTALFCILCSPNVTSTQFGRSFPTALLGARGCSFNCGHGGCFSEAKDTRVCHVVATH